MHFGGCQSGKTVRQFILNSDKNFQGNQNQEIIICMSFMKVDFQASLTKSKRFNLIFWVKNYKLLHMIICKIRNMCELANNQVQWTEKYKRKKKKRGLYGGLTQLIIILIIPEGIDTFLHIMGQADNFYLGLIFFPGVLV